MTVAQHLPTPSASSGAGWSHLSDLARGAMNLPDEDRILWVKEARWCGYTMAKRFLDDFSALVKHPKVDRPPNHLLIGASNNGKSALLHRLVALHPPIERPDGGGMEIPVLFLDAPAVPSEGRLYGAILEACNAPYRDRDTAETRFRQVLHLLPKLGVKLLLIDEIHHLVGGRGNQVRECLNAIKELGNQLRIPIVAAGTQSALSAFQVDSQLSNRFPPKYLPIWDLDVNDPANEYLRLLVSLERLLPLNEPSHLAEAKLAARIHALSEGRIGETLNLLREATTLAIRSKKECIDADILEKCDFVRPSDRKKVPLGLD